MEFLLIVRARFQLLPILLLCWGSIGCVRQSGTVIITATFPPPESILNTTPEVIASEVSLVTTPVVQPSPNPTRAGDVQINSEYVVQPGDTLSSIATLNNVLLDELVSLNNIENPNILSVGQVLQLPSPPTETTPDFKLMSDERFVRSGLSIGFDIATYIAQQPGYIRTARDGVEVATADGTIVVYTLDAAAVVERVSREFSVDPRLLLALLAYRSNWMVEPSPTEEQRLYPMGEVDERRQGLYKQLSWTADRLNQGYYAWLYQDLQVLQFDDGVRLVYEPSLNAASVGLQYFLAQNRSYRVWEQEVDPNGFIAFYRNLFGDSFETVPVPIETQPYLVLPFAAGEVWFYTGGPHGGWGNGSAWAAVDFAPPDEREVGSAGCYTSAYPARAATDGIVTFIGDGTLTLDLGTDANDSTGWSLLYLHISVDPLLRIGQTVSGGTPLGFPSCAGGVSTATHLHIARKYNGAWVPADCANCAAPLTSFSMSDWVIGGYTGQLYQGYMSRNGELRRAEQGRLIPDNRIFW